MHFIPVTSLRRSEIIREASVFFTDFHEEISPLHNFTSAHVPEEIKPFFNGEYLM